MKSKGMVVSDSTTDVTVTLSFSDMSAEEARALLTDNLHEYAEGDDLYAIWEHVTDFHIHDQEG